MPDLSCRQCRRRLYWAPASLRPSESQHGGRVDLLAAMQRLALHIASALMFAVEITSFGTEFRGEVCAK